ncbi:MAG: YigZ family protein [Saprospiraceae bacterium]|nr:YigZ family protein [Saprospiraceae bacterium]
MEFYYSIKQECQSALVEKGSKFLAFAYPVESIPDAQAKLSHIKSLHPKARHWCYAYKIGFPEFEAKSSDDGEPSGTAGKPIFNQIERLELNNVLVVVVRYFGGILLGKGGLLQAYKESAKLCLENAVIIKHEKMVELKIESDVHKIQLLLSIIKNCGVAVKSFELQNKSFLILEISVSSKLEFMRTVKSKMEKTNLKQVENPEDWKDCKITYKIL